MRSCIFIPLLSFSIQFSPYFCWNPTFYKVKKLVSPLTTCQKLLPLFKILGNMRRCHDLKSVFQYHFTFGNRTHNKLFSFLLRYFEYIRMKCGQICSNMLYYFQYKLTISHVFGHLHNPAFTSNYDVLHFYCVSLVFLCFNFFQLQHMTITLKAG